MTYRTVADVPADVRATLPRYAQEVYRASYNISLVYDGGDARAAHTEALSHARRVTIIRWLIAAALVVGGAITGISLYPRLPSLTSALLFNVPTLVLAAVWILVYPPFYVARVRGRERGLLDETGTATIPVMVSRPPGQRRAQGEQ